MPKNPPDIEFIIPPSLEGVYLEIHRDLMRLQDEAMRACAIPAHFFKKAPKTIPIPIIKDRAFPSIAEVFKKEDVKKDG